VASPRPFRRAACFDQGSTPVNKILLSLTSACIALVPCVALAQKPTPSKPAQVEKTPAPAKSPAVPTSGPDLVLIRSADPTIQVELRYATARNAIRRPIYPPNMPGLVRPSVAARLASAQNYLKERGFRLKIWDAYRPRSAQDQLWQFLPNSDFVANPSENVSLHGWGVAVDATIVYANGQAVEMPTDFDEFTPDATLHYTGSKGSVGEHLHILQRAMAQAGFLGLRTEWWHFIAKDWQDYGPIDEIKNVVPQLAPVTRSSPQPTANIPTNRPRSVSK
jgi:zinc D-Ala-D-Ala dipeptidase